MPIKLLFGTNFNLIDYVGVFTLFYQCITGIYQLCFDVANYLFVSTIQIDTTN